jgi:hypothetical protein
MLGRKDYTQEEFDQCKATIDQQIAAYKALVKAVGGASADKKISAALVAFEVRFFNNMVLVLDRFFVHRIRPVAGKDGNPLNEVELLADSLVNNNGVLRGSTVIKLIPDQSVLKLHPGDPIRLTQKDFERLAAAFLTDLEAKFL